MTNNHRRKQPFLNFMEIIRSDHAFMALPPKFIILSNESAHGFERGTFIASFAAIPGDKIALLRNARWLLSNRSGAFLISSFQLVGTAALFRWDADFLVPHNQSAQQCMACIPYFFMQAKKEISWEQRTAVLINNWECVHARGEKMSIADDAERRLIRYEVWGHA